MKLTVLGKYGPYPAAGGACSGYLIEENDTKVLIDCGNGIISRLRKICDIRDLDAVVLSHLHSDHMSDMLILRYALEIMAARGMIEDKPFLVYAPENPPELYAGLSYKNVYEIKPIKENMEMCIGDLKFKFKEMTHPVQSFGMDISNNQKRIVYTGDTNYNPWIEEFAKDADLFLADTGLMKKDKTGLNVPHLTAEEVGKIAAEANVKRLMITHLWPEYNVDALAAEAESFFQNVMTACEMKEYII